MIDADGLMLEPVALWDHSLDPLGRIRALRRVVDTHGKGR
jgi:hypothetical protein